MSHSVPESHEFAISVRSESHGVPAHPPVLRQILRVPARQLGMRMILGSLLPMGEQ